MDKRPSSTTFDNISNGLVEYDKSLFSEADVAGLTRSFVHTLGSVLEARRETLVGDVEILSNEEEQLLIAVGQRSTGEMRQGLVEAIGTQALERPDAIAARVAERQMTYAELCRRSRLVSIRLVSLGVKSGDIVAVCMPRTPDLLVGVLGILSAGAAYLPIEEDLPLGRVQHMADETQAEVIVTFRAAREKICEIFDKVIYVDDDLAEDVSFPSRQEECIGVAYSIFTSGSTGVPKGVLVGGAALRNLVKRVREYSRLGVGDRVLQFSSFVWDTFTEETFPTLSVGGTVVLRGDVSSHWAFASYVRKMRVNVLNLPTAFWHGLVDWIVDHEAECPADLRLVIIGGEQVSAERVYAWHTSKWSSVRLLNTYGLTEATAVSTVEELRGGEEKSERMIGTPIGGVYAHIADFNQRVKPLGSEGELLVGGEGLAFGYLGDAKRTAETFVPDPYSTADGGRVVRTGDVGRQVEVGRFALLGRLDRQVKVGGVRVVLEEIENALESNDQIAEATTCEVETRGQTRVIAFYVSTHGTEIPGLRVWLARILPRMMIPNRLLLVDAMPMTRTGKIDRVKLVKDMQPHLLDDTDEEATKEISREEGAITVVDEEKNVQARYPRPSLETPYVAPRNAIEQSLVEIWQEVLGVEIIGTQDNFFDLGGDSLLLLRILDRARDVGIQILPKQLFDYQTIIELAEAAGAEALVVFQCSVAE